MKITKILATGMLCVTLLTGCGASFEITPDALETYAETMMESIMMHQKIKQEKHIWMVCTRWSQMEYT